MSTRPDASLKIRRAPLLLCLIVIVAAILFFGPVRKSLACPPAPVPMRPLYMISAQVVVARAGQSTLLQNEKVGEDADYQRSLLRTSFYVSKTLKGEDEQVVHVYQWLWGNDRAVPEDYAEGKTLLLFLTPREEGEGYELSNYTYGAKSLSDDDRKVYVERLEELAKILRAKKPDKAEIVEWLVRCAEEPATRWEGTYELYVSQSYLDRETQGDKEQAVENEETSVAEYPSEEQLTPEEEATEDTTVTETVSNDSDSEEFSAYNGEMARLLTAGQKQRLKDVFFNLQSLKQEDMELFALVDSWGDERLTGFILSQLEKAKEDPQPFVEQLVVSLAEKLHSEKLSALAESYSRHATYYDDTEESEEPDADADAEEKALTGNSKQKRSARLKRFLAETRTVMDNQVAMGQATPQ